MGGGAYSVRENLRKARKAAGLTQQAMADKLGISLRYYQQIEAGDRTGDFMGPLVTTPRAAFWSVMVQMRAMDRMGKIMDAAAMVVMVVVAPAQTVRPESRQKQVPHQRAFGMTRTMAPAA